MKTARSFRNSSNKSLIGTNEAKECILLLAEDLREITKSEADKHRAEWDQAIAQKQIDMSLPKLDGNSKINYFEWAKAVEDPRLKIDYDAVHKLASKYVHPSPMSSNTMIANHDGSLLHSVFAKTAMTYSAKTANLVDEMFRPYS